MKTQYPGFLDGRYAKLPAVVDVNLLPCPLCGVDGEQVIHRNFVAEESRHLDDETANGRPAIECGACGIVLCRDTAAEAVRLWNDRSREET